MGNSSSKIYQFSNGNSLVAAFALGLGLSMAPSVAVEGSERKSTMPHAAGSTVSTTLSVRQAVIPVIGAYAATGDLDSLNKVLREGLDAGLSISEIREILVQVYAYAGFPRSLNALGEFMKVVQSRKQQGLKDPEGSAPRAGIPKGDDLLAVGTANQTQLIGAPAASPVFEFAPAIDNYLKTHLFGDIFERDNLDWHSRELATLGMLSAMPGAESQLQSHMRISNNIGMTEGQLVAVSDVLKDKVGEDVGERARRAFDAFKAGQMKP